MKVSRILATALATALVAACASAPPPRKDVVWPEPPETPRIKFAFSFSNERDLERGSWAQFKRGFFGGAPAVSMVHPMGLALTPDGERLYIADLRGGQVLVADLAARTLARFAEGEAWLNPTGVAVDAKGHVFVSDSKARRVVELTPGGELLKAFGKELERPTGLAIDRERQVIYVTDSGRQDSQNHRVFAFAPDGRIIREVGGGRGDGDGQFNFPSYLALDQKGNLHVSDAINFRIQVFDPEGSFVRAFGQQGTLPGTFGRIKGIAFDSFGNIYVADGEHAVVQIFNRRLELLMYFGGPANRVEYFDIPSAVAIDTKRNRIYVANELTARVNAYDLVNTTAEDAIAPEAGAAPGGTR